MAVQYVVHLPYSIRKHPKNTEVFAYFGNGGIRQIGTKESQILQSLGVDFSETLSDNEYRIARAATKFAYGVWLDT